MTWATRTRDRGGRFYDSPRDPVRLVATTNKTLSTLVPGASFGGGTLVKFDRIGLVGQTAAAENGPYVVQPSGPPVRAADAADASQLTPGMFFTVAEGTDAGAGYVLATDADPVIVGTTALPFQSVEPPGSATGPVQNPMTADLDAAGFDVDDVGKLGVGLPASATASVEVLAPTGLYGIKATADNATAVIGTAATGDGVSGVSADGYGATGYSSTSHSGFFQSGAAANAAATLAVSRVTAGATAPLFEAQDQLGVEKFQVNSAGDLSVVKGVPLTWPGANASGALTNDGAGALSWAAGGAGLLLSATVTLTDAQIKALPTTPIQILASPGAGKIAWLLFSIASSTLVASYTNVHAAGVMNFSVGADIAYIPNDAGESLTRLSDLLASSKTQIAFPYLEISPNWGPIQTLPDQSSADEAIFVEIDNGGSGNLTGGNAANTLKTMVFYVVVTL